MSEDGVAPVVAAMLILAIGVTFFAAWNAYYVPSMKAQSEITHLKDVETGFLRFSSDIGTAASLNRNMQLSEPIPLGGGDFTFDAVKSGGLLTIQNDTYGYMRIRIINGTTTAPAINFLHLPDYSYQPVNNFWQDQGYVWSYGYVNVTKDTLATPLQSTGMDNVDYGLTGALFGLEMVPWPEDPAQCSQINVYSVNITPAAGHTVASGNGNGLLALNSTVVSQQFTNVTNLNISINRNLPDGFQSALWDAVNQSANEALICGNVQVIPPDPTNPSSNLTIQMVFAPIPNMTLNRKITEISLGAE
ncbi:hypothetical protein [Methanoregula sp.]|uniref:hypothetical protein n=1 Tax=Methanoregula sp. TaxID=2052170 RepID=UPI003C74ACD4